MLVHQLQVGNMQNFTYVVRDEDTAECVIIDPSWDLVEIELLLKQHGLKVRHIINTHHHFDHTTGNDEMARSTGAPIIQHESSEIYHDASVRDGDTVRFGSSGLRVIHTPGHSKDSICLVGDGKIFTGDTLFVGSCGRVDLPGGDAGEIYDSLFGVLCMMQDGLVVYPGHNYGHAPHSTIGQEKATNPVLQPRSRQEFVAMMGQ